MRIVHVIAGVAVEHGGPTQVLVEMTAELARRGHAVTVLTTDSAGDGRRLAQGGPGELGGSSGSEAPDFAQGVGVELWRALVARSPHPSLGHAYAAWRSAKAYDVAHVHGLFAAPPSLAMAAFRARGLPYVLRPCGMLDAYSLAQKPRLKRAWMAALDRANLLGAARIQASSEHEAEAVHRLLPERRHERVVVLPQGVGAPEAPSGQRLHARPYVLFLSRLAEKKGLLRLVEAYAALAAARPELDLVLVGPDEHGHRVVVEARIQALGLGARVRLPGRARGVDKSDWIVGAEVLALPSDDENFGVVVVEAAHLGTPVVVSDRVGLAPAVARHDAGLVCGLEPPALAAALTACLERGRASFGPGLAALAASCSWIAIGDRLEALYREVARGQAQAHRR